MISIPNKQTRQWVQNNKTDLAINSNVYISKNINFDEEGYLKLSPRTRNIFDEDTYANLSTNVGDPLISISYYDATARYYILGTKNIYYTSSDFFTSLTQDAGAGVPTLSTSGRSDSTSFNGLLHVANGTDVFTTDGSTWTKSYDTSGARLIEVFVNKNELAVGKTNTIELVSTSYVLDITLTIPSQFSITCMAWKNNRMYIGTTHLDNGEAMLFEWDGATTEANNAYSVGANTIYSLTPYKNGVAFMTSEGQLMYFSGGVQELANLPVYYTDMQWQSTGDSTPVNRRVLPRGLIAEGDILYVALHGILTVANDDDSEPNFYSNFPSGVWCYDPKVGLYNKYTIGGAMRLKTSAITTANVNTTTDIITVSGVTVPDTGTPLFYDDGDDGSGTWITPIKFRKRYFTIKQSSTTLKVATTYANALAGTAIDLTGTGVNTQFIVFDPNSDFGGIQNRPSVVYPLRRGNSNAGTVRSDGTKFIIGGSVAKTTNTYKTTISVVAEQQEGRGYAVFPKLYSENIQDNFQTAVVRCRDFINADDKAIVKFRTEDEIVLDFNTNLTTGGVWASTTSFTTTDDLSAAEVGDEVQIVRGSGAGYTAHITVLSYSAPTYTVTIDETIQNITVADTFRFYIHNWKKGWEMTSTDNQYKEVAIDNAKKWVQIKIELRGINTTLEDITVKNVKQLDGR